MSDWNRPRRSWVSTVAVCLVVVACAAGLFLAGRVTAPSTTPGQGAAGTSGPATGDPQSAERGTTRDALTQPDTVRNLPLTKVGRVPYGYSHNAAGARTAAVNALIFGLILRGPVIDPLKTGNPLTALADDDVITRADYESRKPLLSDPWGVRSDGGYVYTHDPVVDGLLLRASIADKPTVQLASDQMTATVTVQWREIRLPPGVTAANFLKAGRVQFNSDFTIRLIWQGDWKIYAVHATQAPVDKRPGSSWIGSIAGFIGEDDGS